MTPAQRAAALRLADSLPTGSLYLWAWSTEAVALLRELLQEPQTPLQEAANAVMAFQWSNSREAMDALTRLVDAAYAEPQAEPVPIAWMHPTHGLVHVGNQTYGFTVPLYAHPPQQRQPLTFAQICELMPPDFGWNDPCTPALVRHIVEAAHGIKEAP